VRSQLRAAVIDGAVPLDAALSIRRAVRTLDGLCAAVDPTTPTHRAEGAPWDEDWALHVAALEHVRSLVLDSKISRVLEFGSGASTVALAHALAARGGSVVSIDQDETYATMTMQAIADAGLDHVATVRTAPLGPVEQVGITTRSYVLGEEDRAVIRALQPELVLIDGPSQVSGGSRVATLPVVAELLEAPAQFLLDDALRDVELEIGRTWASLPHVEVTGVRLIGRGLLHGVAHPSRSSLDR
jgi:hypothetical protein